MKTSVLFIDRDGTLVEEPADRQLDSVDKVRLVRGVIPALLTLQGAGYRFVMVSNQDGLGTATFHQADFEAAQEHILRLFASQGIEFDEVFICPHFADEGCDCRKPKTGLLTRYLAATSLNIDTSAVIGDRQTDLELAEKLGLQGFLVTADESFDCSWDGICAALVHATRKSVVQRTTNETSIRVDINLDIEEPVRIRTGIGFYDHMLEQIAKHAGFSLQIACKGDLQVDEHHTVEDTAICLGTALRQALGDKRGIGRYGFLLPMDESEAQVALDLSGRGSFAFDGDFHRESVGGLPTELVAHFFHSLSKTLGAALHIRVKGDNAHHMIEACFKAVGRTLRQAIRRESSGMPSTKGTMS